MLPEEGVATAPGGPKELVELSFSCTRAASDLLRRNLRKLGRDGRVRFTVLAHRRGVFEDTFAVRYESNDPEAMRAVDRFFERFPRRGGHGTT